MAALLTKARRAFWDAINNAPELKDGNGNSVFRTQFRFEEDNKLLEDIAPTLSQMPALAVAPSTVNMQWHRNTGQRWELVLNVRMWTPGWRLPNAEKWAEQIIRALYTTNISGANVTFVKNATGYEALGAGQISFDQTLLVDDEGEPTAQAILTTFNTSMRIEVDPIRG